MDPSKIGAFIKQLRCEKGLTQKQLAEQLHVSDRTISKWERGRGCPDVSLLESLAKALQVTLDQLLEGQLLPSAPDGGNMKRVKFFVCPQCGNITFASGNATVGCCGRPLEPLAPQPADEAHTLSLVPMDGELYASFDHPMEKGHFISFVAVVGFDRVLLIRLYPEQEPHTRIPPLAGAQYFAYCGSHGLFAMPRKGYTPLH